MKSHIPTTQELRLGRKVFKEKEPRDLFYKAATQLVTLSIDAIVEKNN